MSSQSATLRGRKAPLIDDDGEEEKDDWKKGKKTLVVLHSHQLASTRGR